MHETDVPQTDDPETDDPETDVPETEGRDGHPRDEWHRRVAQTNGSVCVCGGGGGGGEAGAREGHTFSCNVLDDYGSVWSMCVH